MARTSSIKDSVKRVLIYGPSGSGKTTFAGTFPNPVFIDFDKGMVTFKDAPVDIEYYSINQRPTTDVDAIAIIGEKAALKDNAYLKATALIEHFANKLGPGDTLVLDSLSTYSDYTLAHTLAIMGQKTPRIQDWGTAQKLLEQSISLLCECECNIVLVAHEQFVKDDESGVIMWLPLTIGKLATKLPLYFDEVYHTYVERGKGDKKGSAVYGIETTPTRRTTAKSRLKLAGNIENPTFKSLY